MSRVASVVNDPSSVLNELFESYKGEVFPTRVARYFADLFDAQENFSQIPVFDYRYEPPDRLLNMNRPLVRFRGMIQSTDQEVYQSVLAGGKLGGWGLAEGQLEDDSSDSNGSEVGLDDRNTAWAVSVPGETDWMASALDGQVPLKGADRPTFISTQPHKYPLPNQSHLGVHLKLYGDAAVVPKLTEVHTFVGILTEEPLISEIHDGELVVPTLHVFFSRPTSSNPSAFSYPMTPVPSPPNGDEALALRTEEGRSPAERVRSALIKWLATEGLGGDEFAAEWVLLSIISRTFSRSPPVLPLSITLASIPLHTPQPPQPVEPSILSALRLLVPAVVHIPLSIPLLNDSRLAPISKDEDLQSGALQLPEDTVVIVTDSEVSEGTVTERGLRNITTLKQCASAQTLAYSFPFSDYTFKTSLNFLVLAQGKKSPFIDTDVTIPLRSTLPEAGLYKPPSEVALPDPDIMSSFRGLVCGAKVGKVDVSEETSQYIQDDFVRERQQDKTITSDDLVLRMAIARLIALSLHEPSITPEIWERSKNMDLERKKRIA